MRYSRLLVLILVFLLPLSAYGRSREDARIILGQMNVPYTSEQFIAHAAQGDDVVLKLFLELGMDVNAKNTGGGTALMFASAGGHTEVVKLLLSKGADVNAKDNTGWTALMMASAGDHAEVERLLKEARAEEE